MRCTRVAVWVAAAALLMTAAGPCSAWLYDAGIAQHLGVQVRTDSYNEWVAAPFTVASDSYATTLGAAVARGMGPADAGFDVYLTETFSGLLDSAIAKLPQPLVPLNTQYVYYDGPLAAPVALKAGVVYSLVLVPTSPSFIGSASWGVKPGAYIGWGTGDDGANWHQLSYPFCVRVDGYLVPEPGALGVLVVGLFGCGCLKRVRYSIGLSR